MVPLEQDYNTNDTNYMRIREYANKIAWKLKAHRLRSSMEKEEEGQAAVREAEVFEASPEKAEKIFEPTMVRARKRRNDFYIELALFLILGVLMGVAIKKEAVKKVTMGYDDYKMKIYPQDYDLNALEAQAIQKAQDQQAAAAAQGAQGAGGVGSNNSGSGAQSGN